MRHASCWDFDRESFGEILLKQFDFADFSDAMARPGGRELRALKISALTLNNAWPYQKHRKNETKRTRFFFRSQKSVFPYVQQIFEELDNFRRQNQLPCDVWLQIRRSSAPCDPWSSFLNSLCYAHTTSLPWTCGLKSVRRTFQVMASFSKYICTF